MSSKDNRKKGADIETDVEMKDKKEKKRRRRANQQEEGPGPRRPLNAHDLKNLGENSKKTIKRLSAMFKPYKWHMAAVFLGIIISALAGIKGSMFTKTLIDDYIEPLIGQPDPVFTAQGYSHNGLHIPCRHAVYIYIQPYNGHSVTGHTEEHTRRSVRPHADTAHSLL